MGDMGDTYSREERKGMPKIILKIDSVAPVKWYLSQDLTEESHHPGIHRVAGTENLWGLAYPGNLKEAG